MADELGNSLIDSATSDTLKDLAADALELGADALTDNEALKAIPVFGTALKLFKGFSSYRDFLFMKVIYRFLFAYSKVPDKKRTEFLIRMQDEPEFKSKVGEKLIFILNRVDDIDKAEVLGNLFKAYVEGKYNFQTLTRLCAIVNVSFLPDIVNYGVEQNFILLESEEMHLANSGFLETSLVQSGVGAETLSRMYGQRENSNIRLEAIERKKTILKRSLSLQGALILWYGFNVNSLYVWMMMKVYQDQETRPEN